MPALRVANSQESELIAEIGALADDPLAFAGFAYPWGSGELAGVDGPRLWQCDILDIIAQHLQSPQWAQPLKLAVASGHGIGKSALIAMICGWAMSCFEDARINLTANTGKQLDTKTWPELSTWFRRMITAHWFNVKGESVTSVDPNHAETWRIDAVPWSENNPAAFAGLHNKTKIIVLIMDEASEIADKVWEVTEGALTDEDTIIIWVAFGNPTINTGAFARCFGSNKHRWVTRQIDSRTVEGTNKAQLAKWVEDYGEDSDFVRVRVRGEFPRAGSSQFIDGERVAAARKRTQGVLMDAPKILAVDVARFGDDQTVFGLRQGHTFRILDKVRGLSTTEVGRRTVQYIKQHKPRATVIDGDGLGAGTVDTVHDAGYRQDVYEFHGGNNPDDADMYYNKRAEVWGLMRDWLGKGADIPDDPELETDLTGPNYTLPGNRIQLERKEDMKKRGLSSPDTGDALAMTFAVEPRPMTPAEKHEHEQAVNLAAQDRQAAYMQELQFRAQQARSGTFQVSGGRRR